MKKFGGFTINKPFFASPENREIGSYFLTVQLSEDEMVTLYDHSGYVPTYEEIQPFIRMCLRFYDRVSDAEILAWNEQRKNHQIHQASTATEEQKQPTKHKGYIYLLSGGGYHKIGKTIDLDKRLSQIYPKLPFEVELIHWIETDDIDGFEESLHERFADKRTNGEWFELNQEDIDYLKSFR